MEDFEHNGVYFKTNLSYPSSYKASDTPCRIRITPRDSENRKGDHKTAAPRQRQRQTRPNSNFRQPDIEDIRKNLFPLRC